MSNGNDNLAVQRIAGLVDENSFMEIGLSRQEARILTCPTQILLQTAWLLDMV